MGSWGVGEEEPSLIYYPITLTLVTWRCGSIKSTWPGALNDLLNPFSISYFHFLLLIILNLWSVVWRAQISKKIILLIIHNVNYSKLLPLPCPRISFSVSSDKHLKPDHDCCLSHAWEQEINNHQKVFKSRKRDMCHLSLECEGRSTLFPVKKAVGM